MITREEAIAHGEEVVQACTTRFWQTNQDAYKRLQIDFEDLKGHLNLTILVQRYLAHVDTTPDFYATIANYRASLYTACWKACLAHVRQTKAKKREWMFKPGAAVFIDQATTGADGEEDMAPVVETQLAHNRVESFDTYLTQTADLLLEKFGCLTSRIFLLAASGGYTQRQIIARHPRLNHNRIEEVFEEIHSVLCLA